LTPVKDAGAVAPPSLAPARDREARRREKIRNLDRHQGSAGVPRHTEGVSDEEAAAQW
jgi:hypothetical protein